MVEKKYNEITTVTKSPTEEEVDTFINSYKEGKEIPKWAIKSDKGF